MMVLLRMKRRLMMKKMVLGRGLKLRENLLPFLFPSFICIRFLIFRCFGQENSKDVVIWNF